MPDWDADSPQLRQNLTTLLHQMREDARQRLPLDLQTIRQWHKKSMRGLTVPHRLFVGRFRGESGLETIEVRIGTHFGVSASEVGRELLAFERILHRVVDRLDNLVAIDGPTSGDELGAVLDFCAWVHTEWIRIHPFANGNGRMARLLVNGLAMRYGLPPFLRLRPRPDGEYAAVGEEAMRGNWQEASRFFGKMLDEILRGNR